MAQAALKCPKPLFSISLFKKSSALPLDRNVRFKKLFYFRSESPILKIFGFLKSVAQAAQKCPRTLSSISSKQEVKNYGRERFYERILKIFGFLKSVAQAALKCPKPLFSISLFKKSSALPLDRNVWFKKLFYFRSESPILKIFGFLKSAAQAAQKCPRTLSSISSNNFKLLISSLLLDTHIHTNDQKLI